jgi:hypothetical protein
MASTELTPQRGAIPVDLDRPRVLFFDHNATWLLIQKYGERFVPELYRVNEKRELVLHSMDALAYFLWAGVQRDALEQGAPFTLTDAQDALRPYTYTRIFKAVLLAVVGGTAAPAPPGKPQAPGAEPEPSAADPEETGTARAASPPEPGPTKVMTSSRRSASR